MTPTKSSQNPSQATNTSSTTSATQSYASATKKAVASSPAIATSSSSQSPAVAVGNAPPVQEQNGKASSISPVNGRAPPAVPVVSTPAIASSNGDHSRKGSVTINKPFFNGNGGPVGGPGPKLQFGSLPTESPAITSSSPQIASSTSSAPIPIPNSNPRVISPAQSPSPIPQVSKVSGGLVNLSGSAQPSHMKFGSLNDNGDGDRSKPLNGPNTPVLAPGHMRNNSSQSQEMSGSNGGRGGFQQGGRGRGGYNNFNNNNAFMGPGAQQYRGPGQGRGGGMPPPFQSQGRPQMNQYPGSPHQAARSPALTHAIPGTPNMPQAMPMQGQPQYQYQQQMGYGPVYPPSPYNASSSRYPKSGRGKGKKQNNGHRGPFRDADAEYHSRQNGGHQQNSQIESEHYRYHMNPELSETYQPQQHGDHAGWDTSSGPLYTPNVVDATDRQFPYTSLHGQAETFEPRLEAVTGRAEPTQPHHESHFELDLSPNSGNFEVLSEHLLTHDQQNAYYQPYEQRMNGMPMPQQQYGMYAMNYPQVGQMGVPPQSPQLNYQNMQPQQGPYVPGQYAAPSGQPMSRSSSQVSERPTSSMGHPQTPSMPPTATLQTQLPLKPSTSAQSSFVRPNPRKSAAIQIKKPDGEVLEVSKLPTKVPASPAPSARTSTPPVIVSSTPTPPPKSTTPQVPRTDSPAAKSAEQKKLEFKSQISKAVQGGETQAAEVKPGEDEAAKAAEQKKNEEAAVKADAEAKAKADAESKAKADAEEAKAKADAEAKSKEEAEAKAKKDVEVKAEAVAAAPKETEETEDEMWDRLEREALEKDKAEEEATKQYEAKRKAEKEAAAAKAAALGTDEELKKGEREMEAWEEAKRLAAEKGEETKADPVKATPSIAPKASQSKLSSMMNASDSTPATASDEGSMGPPPSKLSPAAEKRAKPAALNLTPLNTKPVEAPQPSAALQSLKSARFLNVINASIYPSGIASPNPALNPAVTAKGKSFKYDKEFLLQFQKVFTEKPSLEFESQIKALIGDGDSGSSRSGSSRTPGGGMAPRQNSNRNAPGNFSIMGNFGSGVPAGGKTTPLPPGTTSQERFLMSSGAMPRPQSQSFGRPVSAFGGPNAMNRIPSSSHMSNQMPQSPRQGNNSRSQRNNSKRADTNKDDAKSAKTMPLTAGMDLKPITVSASGWKPSSIGKAATGAAGPTPGAASGHMQPDMVQRKVKAALNKMTPDNFDRISDQILLIAAQSKEEQDGRTLRQVIQLTFEKATDEAHWASMYAKFCKRMLETMSPEIRDEGITDKNGNVVSGGNLFRKYLLNRCQEEFERGWKSELPEKPEGERGEEKTEEAVMLSDDYYVAAAAKRRGLGLVQFIGELYKLGMLTERIMHECVKKLVDYTSVPDEAEIESLTKLLKTIGSNLDNTEKGKPMMDIYFQRIQGMIDIPDLPSRLQFMLMDIVDLRSKHWRSKEDNKGPKTLDEVRAEAEAAAAQKAAENARPQRGGGGNNRMSMGRGDGRNYGNQFSMPPPDHNRSTVQIDDLRRLQGSNRNRQSSGPGVFGPSSMFTNRSSSGRRMGGGSMRGAESGASSRTGTPPQNAPSSTTSVNAFSLLADMSNSGETENPTSPPTSNATPATNTENE